MYHTVFGDVVGTLVILAVLVGMYFFLKWRLKAGLVWIEPKSDLAVLQRNTVLDRKEELNPQLVIGVRE